MSTTEALSGSETRPTSTRRLLSTGYVVSPLYDWVFFITAPLSALFLGLALAGTPFNDNDFLPAYEKSLVDFGIGVFIFAHLFISIFRTHLNPKIFRLHPLRFTLIPLALFGAMLTSNWVLVFCSVLATFWDVYHSGMQTFGLSRIYDARAGNRWDVGRRLDWILNLYLYAGPIAAGATLMDHVEDFYEFREVGAVFFVAIPAYTASNAKYLSWIVIGTGIPFLAYYLYRYWTFSRQGYQVSPQKVILLLSTAACSIYAWGFNPFGMAFFIMNFFHALQYFAIVYWAENGNVSKVMGCEGRSWAKPAALFAILVVGFGYGYFAEASGESQSWLFALFLVVSLMHFWYDSFIWSVARKQV